MTIKIRFLYCGEAGYWVSAEGRYEIFPGGFRHGVTPDYYELYDNVKKCDGYRAKQYSSVAEAKQAALATSISDVKLAVQSEV